MFFAGKIGGMPPKLLSKDGRNVVLRPLAYVPEDMLVQFQQELAFPVIPCNLCGSQDNLQRQKMKALLKQLEADIPNVANTMLNAQKNVQKSLLLDRDLWDFEDLAPVAGEV